MDLVRAAGGLHDAGAAGRRALAPVQRQGPDRLLDFSENEGPEPRPGPGLPRRRRDDPHQRTGIRIPDHRPGVRGLPPRDGIQVGHGDPRAPEGHATRQRNSVSCRGAGPGLADIHRVPDHRRRDGRPSPGERREPGLRPSPPSEDRPAHGSPPGQGAGSAVSRQEASGPGLEAAAPLA
jgi:hypothetical protein